MRARLTSSRATALVFLLSSQCLAAASAESPTAVPREDASLESFHGDVPPNPPPLATSASPEPPPPDVAPARMPAVVAGRDAPAALTGEEVSHFTDRPVTVQGAVGLGTIVGNLGVLGVVTPHDRVSLVAGVGITPWGVRWGAGLRLRALMWPRRKTVQALTIAPGFTMGDWESLNDHLHGEDLCDPDHDEDCGDGPFTSPPRNYYIRRIDNARWVQLDVGYELRTRALSVFAGPFLAALLNPEDCVLTGDVRQVRPCSEETTPLDRDSVTPLSFGISAFVGF